MTKNQKIAIGVGAGVLILWAYSRNKAGKSLNPFSKSSSLDGSDTDDEDEDEDENSANFSIRGNKRKKPSPFGQNKGAFGGIMKRNYVSSQYDGNDNTTWMAKINNPSGYWISGQFPVGAMSRHINELPK